MSRLYVLLVFALLLACGAPALAATYALTDLGTLGGPWSIATAINSGGAVTGRSARGATSYGFVFKGSGPMAPVTQPAWACSGAGGISDTGQIAGWFCNAPSSAGQYPTSYAFLDNGTVIDLGSLAAAQTPCVLGYFSEGVAINNAGQITGSTCTNTLDPGGVPEVHAFLYSNGGALQDLGTLGGPESFGEAINARGWVTGFADTGNPTSPQIWHAFLYGNRGPMQDLGTLGGLRSIGWSINDAGQVTGEADGSTGTHAFLYATGSPMQDLGTLSPEATFSDGAGINSAGQIVGMSDTPLDTRGHGFLYSGGTMFDLNALIDPQSTLLPYVTLTFGVAINNSGWIAANGIDSRTGNEHAYLLSQPSGPPPCHSDKFVYCVLTSTFTPCSVSHISLCVEPCAFPGCGHMLVNWATPVIVRGDPWLNGVSLSVLTETPEQARAVAAGLAFTVSTEPQIQTVAERTTNAVLTEGRTSKSLRALIVGPIVDAAAAAAASPAAPGQSSAAGRTVSILSLPYATAGLPSDASFRMVTFEKGRWLEVRAESVNTARHVIQASVSPSGKFTVVAVTPEPAPKSTP